jgi:DNA-directed RNA polymerase specialized sigma subunit
VQIAAMLGLTKGRISQLHRAGLERMSGRLAARRLGRSQVF